MRFVSNQGITDPSLNLALEEYILRALPATDDYLLFYINEPSIIIGKNQNTLEEINAEYVRENHIHVVRRLSGGGAVYHDLGNLNYSFIVQNAGADFHNFQKFTEPVIRALRGLGVEAELSGRNDIVVGERKISGNAQFQTRGKMYTHGTLLFNSNSEHIASALKVSAEKYASKSTKSVRSRVANITEFLDRPMTIEQFRDTLLQSIFGTRHDIPEYVLTDEDWVQVRKLADERYRTWEWNYGRSPVFNVQLKRRIEGAGTFDVRLQVDKGVISEAAIYGDYFGRGDSKEVAEKMIGIRYDRDSLSKLFEGIDLTYYFGPVTMEAWLDLLI